MKRLLHHAWRAASVIIFIAFLTGLYIIFNTGTSFPTTHDLKWLRNQIKRNMSTRRNASAAAYQMERGASRAELRDTGVAVVTSDHNSTENCVGLDCTLLVASPSTKTEGVTDAAIFSRFTERQTLVRQVCVSYHGAESSKKKMQFRFLYFSKKYNLMVCATPKYSSAKFIGDEELKVTVLVWQSLLVDMQTGLSGGVCDLWEGNLDHIHPVMTWRWHIDLDLVHAPDARRAAPDTNLHTGRLLGLVKAKYVLGHNATLRRLPSATTLMVVRHSLDRLVSAYRDKFRNGGPLYRSRSPSHYRAYWRPALKMLQRNTSEPQNITFTEFVQFVRTHRWDPHWKPLHVTCVPCSIHYDYVVRLETFQEDLDYLHRRLPNPVLGYHVHRHITKNATASSESDKETMATRLPNTTLHYYRQLPPDLLAFVLHFYSFDMQLFGYHYPEELARRAAQAGHSEGYPPKQSRRGH